MIWNAITPSSLYPMPKDPRPKGAKPGQERKDRDETPSGPRSQEKQLHGAKADSLAGAAGGMVARMIVNNPVRTLARYQQGLPINQALDLSLQTCFKVTWASALQGSLAYGLKERLSPSFEAKLGHQIGDLAAESLGATAGVLASHPFMVSYLRGGPSRAWCPTWKNLHRIYQTTPRLFLRGVTARTGMGITEFTTFCSAQRMFSSHFDDATARFGAAALAIMASTPFYQVSLKQIVEDKGFLLAVRELYFKKTPCLTKSTKPLINQSRNRICLGLLYLLSVTERFVADGVKHRLSEPDSDRILP